MTQADPNGLSLSTPGAKADLGKNQVGLMISGFSRALTQVAKVTTYGAKKYSPNGWLQVPEGETRYKDAMYRHLLASEVEEIDQESKIDHLAHAAWNILALYELSLRKEENESLNLGPLPPPISPEDFFAKEISKQSSLNIPYRKDI